MKRVNIVECVGYDGIGCGHDGCGDDIETNAPGQNKGPEGHLEPPNRPAIDRTNL